MLTQFIVGGTTVNAYDRIREFEMAEYECVSEREAFGI